MILSGIGIAVIMAMSMLFSKSFGDPIGEIITMLIMGFLFFCGLALAAAGIDVWLIASGNWKDEVVKYYPPLSVKERRKRGKNIVVFMRHARYLAIRKR